MLLQSLGLKCSNLQSRAFLMQQRNFSHMPFHTSLITWTCLGEYWATDGCMRLINHVSSFIITIYNYLQEKDIHTVYMINIEM